MKNKSSIVFSCLFLTIFFSCNNNSKDSINPEINIIAKDVTKSQNSDPQLNVGSKAYGGIIVSINNGHGMVASEYDNGSGTWDEAMHKKDNYKENGFTDWRLPTKDELYELYTNLHKKGIGNFINGNYWSSTDKEESAWELYFKTGEFNLVVKGSHEGYYDRASESIKGSNDNLNIRLVRSF